MPRLMNVLFSLVIISGMCAIHARLSPATPVETTRPQPTVVRSIATEMSPIAHPDDDMIISELGSPASTSRPAAAPWAKGLRLVRM